MRWSCRPRLFLRTTEFLWQEGHTAHASAEDAWREVLLALDFYEACAVDACALAPFKGEKTASERFAGAERTTTIEAMMRDGRALQSGTSHFLGQNFARAFDMRFQTEEGELEYCYTTSWGVSTRMVGAVIMGHGDDKGLILPPAIAPYQVVVVPIGRDEEAEGTLEAACDLGRRIAAEGIRVKVDERVQLSPGFKFNEWELRGVPLRIELGPRDLAAGTVVEASRLALDRKDKATIPVEAVASQLGPRLAEFQGQLQDRGRRFRDDHTVRADTWDELVAAVEDGFALALACDSPECEERLKEATTATPRRIPFEGDPETGPCVICGAPSAYGTRLVFGRAY